MVDRPAPPQGGTPLQPRHTAVTWPAPRPGAPRPGGAGLDPASDDCRAVSAVLVRVGDKWSVLVVALLGDGPRRFNEIRRLANGISQRMLTVTLRGLERDGLVARTVTASTPPRVDYALTALGRSLWEPVRRLSEWARAHNGEIEAAREEYDGRSAEA